MNDTADPRPCPQCGSPDVSIVSVANWPNYTRMVMACDPCSQRAPEQPAQTNATRRNETQRQQDHAATESAPAAIGEPKGGGGSHRGRISCDPPVTPVVFLPDRKVGDPLACPASMLQRSEV